MNDGSDDWSHKIAWSQIQRNKAGIEPKILLKTKNQQHNCFKPNNLVTPWTSPTQTKNKQHK